MKRLIVLLSVLSLVAMLLPSRTPAQDDWDIEFRAKRRAAPAPVAVPIRTYAEPPPVILPMHAGTGCRGQAPYAGGGCISRSAAPAAYAVPVQAGGCVGRSGGCYGYAAGRGYGAPLGNGQFATPSGRPAPPGVFPINTPLIGAWRAAAGYDRHYRP